VLALLPFCRNAVLTKLEHLFRRVLRGNCKPMNCRNKNLTSGLTYAAAPRVLLSSGVRSYCWAIAASSLILAVVASGAVGSPFDDNPLSGWEEEYQVDGNVGDSVELGDSGLDADGSGWSSATSYDDIDPGPAEELSDGQQEHEFDSDLTRDVRIGEVVGAKVSAMAHATPTKAITEVGATVKAKGDKSAHASTVPASGEEGECVAMATANATRVYSREAGLDGYWIAQGAAYVVAGFTQGMGFGQMDISTATASWVGIDGDVVAAGSELSLSRDEHAAATSDVFDILAEGVPHGLTPCGFSGIDTTPLLCIQLWAIVWDFASDAYDEASPQAPTYDVREPELVPVEAQGESFSFEVVFGASAAAQASASWSGNSSAVGYKRGFAFANLLAGNRHAVLLASWAQASPPDNEEVLIEEMIDEIGTDAFSTDFGDLVEWAFGEDIDGDGEVAPGGPGLKWLFVELYLGNLEDIIDGFLEAGWRYADSVSGD
jgi:hypothetical protein